MDQAQQVVEVFGGVYGVRDFERGLALGFGALSEGDVFDCAFVVDEFSAFIADRVGIFVDPDAGAIAADEFVLEDLDNVGGFHQALEFRAAENILIDREAADTSPSDKQRYAENLDFEPAAILAAALGGEANYLATT